MKTVEVIGFKRANLGKSEAQKLRLQGMAPCVLYGGQEQVHFYAPMILFRDVVYTPEACFVKLNIEGQTFDAILQDIDFHPVNEMIMHADFLLLQQDKPVKMDIPVRFTGNSVGVAKGGKLVAKQRKLKVRALPANMPDFITVDVAHLDLGKTVKVGAISQDQFAILNSPNVPVVSIEIPRALRGKVQAD